MKVRMLTSISGVDGAAARGELWTCTAGEGKRLIAAGLAEPAGKATRTQTAVQAPVETATDD